MSHKLGVYFAPEHHRQSDRDYIAKLQPPVIRLLDPDVQQIADMHALCPDAIIAPRTWIIDDHDGAAVRNLMADPIGTGRDHAQQFSGQLGQWQEQARSRGLKIPAPDRLMFSAANEPNQGGTPDKIAAYNVAFLNRCTELGIRAAALCLGVGWPDNSGPDTPVNWKPYADAGLVEAIKRGQHWLDLHEYHYKTGPQDGWRWLAGRHLQCPFDVPILLGEIGIDNYVDKNRWDREGGNRGWKGNVSPDAYADMIERHMRGCDTRVVAGLIFITDYRSNAWESFDTSDAHGALLARKDAMVPQVQFATAPTPAPAPHPVPHFVTAVAGLNLRAAPVTGKVLAKIPFGSQVNVIAPDSDNPAWFKVRYQDTDGYVYSHYLGRDKPTPAPTPEQPQPAPMPTGIIDPRVAQAILNIESGGRTHGENGKPIIRFEAHVFRDKAKDKSKVDQFFRFDANRPWLLQEWRSHPDKSWTKLHTGSQGDEYAALSLAQTMDREAAYQAISVGAGQILGINFAKLGYPSAEAMFNAFQSAPMQTIGFINFFLSDPGLLDAMRRKDWREIARRYNGAGAVDTYAPLLEKAYRELGGA